MKESEGIVGVSFHRDFICLADAADGVVRSIGARELVQPFGLDSFQETGKFHENQFEILEELVLKSGVQNREAGAVLHGGMVLLKKSPVPIGLDDTELRQHLSWEAEQCLSAPLEEFVFEFERIPTVSPSGSPAYLLIFVRKRVIQAIQSLMGSIGVKLKSVDVDVFCNLRALMANYDLNPEDYTVLIDIQRRDVVVYFIHQGEYFLSHKVSVREGGSASEFHDVGDFIEMLRKELRRLIFGYRIGKGFEDLSRIFLMGNDVIHAIAQDMMNALSVPVEIVNPFRKISVSEAVSASEEFQHSPERYTTAVGMAIKSMRNGHGPY